MIKIVETKAMKKQKKIVLIKVCILFFCKHSQKKNKRVSVVYYYVWPSFCNKIIEYRKKDCLQKWHSVVTPPAIDCHDKMLLPFFVTNLSQIKTLFIGEHFCHFCDNHLSCHFFQ